MASERIQRRIDAFLDEADAAAASQDWTRVAGAARAVLAIDEEHPDARAFLAMAAANGAGATAPEESPTDAAVAPAVPPSSSAHPDSFAGGRYLVRRFLGEGGKKRVFLAHDEILDRDVAFALIKTEGLDATGRERIVREAQAMGRLGSHPHVVSIFDIGEHTSPNGTAAPYVVTELMGGGDVEGVLEDAEGPLPLDQSLRIAQDVARGLAFAHGKQVVHRDLKPGNVWLTAEGTAKIGDFGLAVSLDRSRLTQHGMMVGTVAYMPPEQALGGEVTPQADVYSLGAMLYEMVTGRPPFQGSDPTAIISQHINTPPVAPSWHTERCPPELEELILRLLEKDPGKRPASAAEALELLERVDPEGKSATHSGSANPLDRLARGVFVGREKELERLRSAFDDAFAGRGSVVMLVGEPGVGKTRTAQELETYARMRGAYVFWGRTHESSGMPAYWPWVQVGNAWGAAVDLMGTGGQALAAGGTLAPGTSELVRIFPALRQLPGFVEPEPITEPEAAQFRLFDAYAQFMRDQSTERPWLVLLDDLHWADKPTLQLLQFVARELANMRVLIVGSYRDTELARTHPLSEALAELNREGGFLRLPLRGLSREEVAAYVGQRTAVHPSRGVVDRIYEETEGNPFFLSEVVNLMTEEGTLDRHSLSDIALPEGVREALGRRLDRLSDEANELLQVCAIVGREFTYETLTLLGERTDDELLRLIEEALAARVVEETETPGRYRFTHALMQETLLGELSTTRRVRLHGQVGEALERRYGANADARAARLALHFAESATLTPAHAEKAVHYSRLAGEQAEAQYAWDEAGRHYSRAAEYVESGSVPGDADALRARQGLNELRDLDLEEGEGRWLTTIRSYMARGEDRAAGRLAGEFEPIHVNERFFALMRSLASRLESVEPHLAAWLWCRSGLPGWEEQAQAARARGRELVDEHGISDPEVELLLLVGTLERPDVPTDEFNTTITRLRDLLAVVRGSRARAWGLLAMTTTQWSDLDWLREDARNRLKALRQEGRFFTEPHTLSQIAATHLLRGEFDDLERVVRERMHRPNLLPRWVGARALALRGEAEAALVRYPDLPGAEAPLFERPIHSAYALVHGRRAGLLASLGRDEEASSALERWEEEWDRLRYGVVTQYRLYCFAAVDDALPILGSGALVERVYAEVSQHVWRDLRLDAVDGIAIDPLRGKMALRLGLIDDAEHWFGAGRDWAEQQRCPIELGRCLLGLAEVAELRGQREEAMTHLDRAGELFAQYGAKLYLDQVLAKKEILKA